MAELPPLPAGFKLDTHSALPPLPEGFSIDAPQATQEAADTYRSPATALDRVQASGSGFNHGVAALLGMPVDTVETTKRALMGAAGFLYSKATGEPVPAWAREAVLVDNRRDVPLSGENIESGMNKVGIQTRPNRPDDQASRYLYAGASALPAVAAMRPSSAGQAVVQGLQAAAVGATPEAVKYVGGGQGAQTGATLAASVLLPAGGATMRAAGRAATGAIEPLTEAGRRTIAGSALRQAATNADQAAVEMGNVTPFVRGSKPTAGAASRDPGIAFFENRLRALNAPAFSERISAQNDARQRLLDTVALGGENDAITALKARRDAVTSKMRDQAFQEASGQATPTQDVVKRIDALLADPENAGKSVQQALQSVKAQLFKADGNLVTDARAVYAIRKEINRVLEGKYVDANESVLRYAGGQLKNVRDSIDEAITEVAPSWKPYLTKYAQLSKPIERVEKIGEIRGRTDTAAPDIQTGRSYLSQAKWRNVVTKNLPEIKQTFTKGQVQKLQMITADLDRGAAATSSASVRVPGSDTAANLVTQGNLSVANIVGRALGREIKDLPPALATLSRPLSWIYKVPDESVRTLIVDAMLDPDLAAQLIRQGTRENVQAFADSLRNQAKASGIILANDKEP